jgi:hypothetical protein
MTQKRHTEEQIIAVLKDAQAGVRFRREEAGDSEQDACSTGQPSGPMRENVLYSWLGGKTQREKQSGYITREKQKKQIQHVLSIGLPLLTN